jgi:rifampin ADP-ribosylating transferase
MMTAPASLFVRQYFHGTRARLSPGDLIVVGHRSNFREDGALSWVYFTGTLDAAIWGAELAEGQGKGRILVVESTGDFEDDPNLTDKRFPDNPTQSYRSRGALRIVAEVTGWTGHDPDKVRAMKVSAREKSSRIID